MRIETLGRFKRISLNPGEFHASSGAVTISTLLGSCVAACLYDPVNRVIGMNHFLLSNRRYSLDLPNTRSEAGRYGIYAMELLINDLMRHGAKRKNLQAKAFGGATIFGQSQEVGNFYCVGEVNIRFIREFLESERIPLVAESLGGAEGRVVHFSNGDFAVHVRKIRGNRNQALARRDRDCWLRNIERQEQTMPSVDLWL